MSGIVGILRRNGAPVERSLLAALTDFLSYRGPDRLQVWCEGSVGFGHTLLRTRGGSGSESIVSNSERELWVTADARIDCRSELVEMLYGTIPDSSCKNDSELILEAYAKWGDDCVQHLRGDFAFALWDGRCRKLFCARDHFGIKPFYYAETNGTFLFSNTLNCVRLHPDVSDEFNDLAILDFLLFGLNCDLSTTSFRDIRRLPPAHFLSLSATQQRIGRYWSPPIDGHLRYRSRHEYIEEFRRLFRLAVGDRLRTDRAGILLSGGLDSASVAAVAGDVSRGTGSRRRLRAYTNTFGSPATDRDAAQARKTAEFLRIPIELMPADKLELFDGWNDTQSTFPEPIDNPLFTGTIALFRAMAANCNVVLSGEGSDNLMYFQMWPHIRYLIRNREWREAIGDGMRYIALRQFPWRGLRQFAKQRIGGDSFVPTFPQWILPELRRSKNLGTRWERCNNLQMPLAQHPRYPKGHASLNLPQWSRLFELTDPGLTGSPVEVRYPFLDLRMVDYFLALPPFPWAFKKTLLREAMLGRLPASTLVRPKTAMMGDPVLEKLFKPEAAWIDQTPWCDEINRYVKLSALPRLTRETNSTVAELLIRPWCLNFWLRSARRIRYKVNAEAQHGKSRRIGSETGA